MIDMFADKPHCINNTLPAELRLEWSGDPPENLSFQLTTPGGACITKPQESRRDGCYVWVVIPEHKLLCAGRYCLNLYDDCELCDIVSVELKASCFVREVIQESDTKTKTIKCGDC